MNRKMLQVLCLCVAGLSAVARADEKPPFDLSDPKRIDAGRQRFSGSCTGYCHGNEGRGGRAPAFIGRDDLDVDYIFHTVTNGRRSGGMIMPRWGETYSPEEVWELVAYVHFLNQQKN